MNFIKAPECDLLETNFLKNKPKRVRWKPEGFDQYSSHFVTGSYESYRNAVELWFNPRIDIAMDIANNDEEEINTLQACHQDCTFVDGDVTEIKFLNNNHLLCTTSNGSVYMLEIYRDEQKQEKKLRSKLCWSNLHTFRGNLPSSCNALDINEEVIATAGEDGSIFLLNMDSKEPLQRIEDSSSVTSAIFVRRNEIVVGNELGQLKLWDIRDTFKPMHIFPLRQSEIVSVTVMANFPSQKHMLVVGGDNGVVVIYDMRNVSLPVQVYSTNSSAVTDIHFHPSRSSVMFTSSSNGEVWQWSNFVDTFNNTLNFSLRRDSDIISFSQLNQMKVKILVDKRPFYTNNVDSNRDRLLCSAENYSIIMIQPLHL